MGDLPDRFLSEVEAAAFLTQRGLPCSPATVRNMRVRGALGSVKFGGRYFYTERLMADCIEALTICQEKNEPISMRPKDTARSGHIGSAKSKDGEGQTMLGAGAGTTQDEVKRATSALARQTFRKPAKPSKIGSSTNIVPIRPSQTL